MPRVYYSRIRTGRRVILRVVGIRLLQAAAVLLDEIGRAANDQHATFLAECIRRAIRRYGTQCTQSNYQPTR